VARILFLSILSRSREAITLVSFENSYQHAFSRETKIARSKTRFTNSIICHNRCFLQELRRHSDTSGHRLGKGVVLNRKTGARGAVPEAQDPVPALKRPTRPHSTVRLHVRWLRERSSGWWVGRLRCGARRRRGRYPIRAARSVPRIWFPFAYLHC
jgi:hypothetical protein